MPKNEVGPRVLAPQTVGEHVQEILARKDRIVLPTPVADTRTTHDLNPTLSLKAFRKATRLKEGQGDDAAPASVDGDAESSEDELGVKSIAGASQLGEEEGEADWRITGRIKEIKKALQRKYARQKKQLNEAGIFTEGANLVRVQAQYRVELRRRLQLRAIKREMRDERRHENTSAVADAQVAETLEMKLARALEQQAGEQAGGGAEKGAEGKGDEEAVPFSARWQELRTVANRTPIPQESEADAAAFRSAMAALRSAAGGAGANAGITSGHLPPVIPPGRPRPSPRSPAGPSGISPNPSAAALPPAAGAAQPPAKPPHGHRGGGPGLPKPGRGSIGDGRDGYPPDFNRPLRGIAPGYSVSLYEAPAEGKGRPKSREAAAASAAARAAVAGPPGKIELPDPRALMSGLVRANDERLQKEDRLFRSSRAGTAPAAGPSAGPPRRGRGGEREPEEASEVRLQARLERVQEQLEMPLRERLDMAIKYTTREHAPRLERAVAAWEDAARAVAKVEDIVRHLEEVDRQWEERRLVGARMAEEPRDRPAAESEEAFLKERAVFSEALERYSERCRNALESVRRNCGDEVTLRGAPYAEKMARDARLAKPPQEPLKAPVPARPPPSFQG
eukprot:tig00020603_g11765.t1